MKSICLTIIFLASTLAQAAQQLDPQNANSLVKKGGAVIVDVRETNERTQVIEGAISAPTTQLNDDKEAFKFIQSLPKNKTVIFHCARGVRAAKMADKFTKLGLRTAYFTGIDDWKAAGLPLKTNP